MPYTKIARWMATQKREIEAWARHAVRLRVIKGKPYIVATMPKKILPDFLRVQESFERANHD